MDPETEKYLALAKMSQDDFFNRRQLEWRLGFAVWTAIGIFTAGFFATDNLHIPNDVPLVVICIAYMMLFILCIVAQVFIQVAHWRSLRYYFYFRSKASGWQAEADANILIDAQGKVTRVGEGTWRPWGGKEYPWVPIHWWWLLIHVGTTLFLMVLSFLLISHIPRAAIRRQQEPAGVVIAPVSEPNAEPPASTR